MADETCPPLTYTLEDCCISPLVGGPTNPGPPGPVGPPGPPGTSCPLFCGVGSPEGVVASPIGGIYEQTDAASTSHSVWFKHSGVGDTGWRQWAGLRGGDGANTALRLGDNSISTGVDSVAIGENAEATGVSAVAIGKNTLASGARAEAFGQDSEATADDAKAFGVGAKALAVKAIAFGPLAQVDAVEGISIGDGRGLSINDISIGYSHDFGVAVAHGSILIGKNATINTATDTSSATTSLYGAHILIGEDTETPYAATQFQNVVIGFKAKARGRAVIAIGQEAESRAIDVPVVGKTEGRFAVIIGYKAKVSGGCLVAIGDQADVRGNNAGAIGTNSRANDNNCWALGSSAFAGSLTSDGSGVGALAVGESATCNGAGSVSIGGSIAPGADYAVAIGLSATVEDNHIGAIALGAQAVTTAPRQIMIGGEFDIVTAIHFNGSPNPAFLIAPDGTVSFVGGTSSVSMPYAGNYQLTLAETNFFVSAQASARTITLPSSTGVPVGKLYYIRKDDSSANTVTVARTGGDTIEGAASNYALTAQYKFVSLQNLGGGDWQINDNN